MKGRFNLENYNLTVKSRGFLYSLENVSDEIINTALLGFISNEVEVLRDFLYRIIKIWLYIY